MTENEIVEIKVDTSNVKLALEELTDSFSAMKSLAKEIVAAISKAFLPLQKCLEKIEGNVSAMTSTLTDAASEFERFVQIFEETQAAEQWEQNVMNAFNGVATTIGTIASVAGALLAADVVAPIVAVVAVIMAVVALIIAAIVEVVKHWDEIKQAFTVFFTETIPQLWGQFVEWLSGIASSATELFSTVASAIGDFFTKIWNQLVTAFTGIGQWAQENVMQPIVDVFKQIVGWFSELFGSIWQTISDVIYNVGIIISGCWELLVAVWAVAAEWFEINVIQPLVGFFVGLWTEIEILAVNTWNNIKEVFSAIAIWVDQNIIQPVAGFFANLWTSISTWAVDAWNGIVAVFTGVAAWFSQNVIQPVEGFFTGLWNGFSNAAKQAWEGVKTVFSKVAEFFKDVFTNAWSSVVDVFSVAGEIFTNIKDGILTAFKSIVNGIIKGLNGAISIPFNGINLALEKIKNINILGLTPFSGLKTISVPQIPYLAKGAVLPANKPFLAVVGDQRHGTNVEAPLATIQEAVALVMNDHISAMMAGFEALLQEQRAIRQTVEGIEIGDSVIGRAAQRYNRKMAIVKGGY